MSFTRREQVEGAPAYLDLSHLEERPEGWAGRQVRIQRPGEPVDPCGYQVVTLVHNARTGAEWLEMFGGDADRKGTRHFRSCRPEHVRDMTAAERRRWFPIQAREETE